MYINKFYIIYNYYLFIIYLIIIKNKYIFYNFSKKLLIFTINYN